MSILELNMTDDIASPQGNVEIERGSEGLGRVVLSDSWTIHAHLPDIKELLGQIETARKLKLDAKNVSEYDTEMLRYVLRLYDFCDSNEITLDITGLPTGIQNLVRLARAVPEKKEAKKKERHPSYLESIGSHTFNFYKVIIDMLDFIGQEVKNFSKAFRGRASYLRSDLLLMVQHCGIGALPIVSLISFLVGLIIAFIGAIQLQQFGADIYVANLVAAGMSRELGAMMTAIIMAGRTGAAFAAQLGTMRVNQEIDALTTFGISPTEFLVLPRMAAFILMMPLLVLYADLMGILGGSIVGIFMLDISATEYYEQTKHAVTLTDFSVGIVKGTLYGILVVIAGCLRGLQCGKSASAVGEAATSAVVLGIVLIILASAVTNVITHVLQI